MVILMGLSLFAHSWNPSTSETQPQARLCNPRPASKHESWTPCTSEKKEVKEVTLFCVYESETPLKTCSFKQSMRENSGVTVWGAVCNEVTEPSDPFWQLCLHLSPRCCTLSSQPAGPWLMDQKGRCILAVIMNTVVSLVWQRTAFPCLQGLRCKFSHFHSRSKMEVLYLNGSCMRRLKVWAWRDTAFWGRKQELMDSSCWVFLAAP